MPPDRVPQVIVTVQHNGMSDSVFDGQFVKRSEDAKNDLGVISLAMCLYRKAYPHIGIVYNQVPRRFVDTNRDPEDRLEWMRPFADPKLAPYFFGFHGTVEKMITESAETYGKKVCLLDLHGFAKQPLYAPKDGFHVILGTRNRRSVKTGPDGHMLSPDLWIDLDRRLAESLASQGLSVFCPEYEPYYQRQWLKRVSASHPHLPLWPRGNDSIVDEEMDWESGVMLPPPMPDEYDGAYLVGRHVGTESKLAAAIQIEVVRLLRDKPSDITEEGSRKRSSFVNSVSELVCRMCS